MTLFPLAIPTKESVMYHADVHLQYSQIFVNKVISDALHHHLGNNIPSKVNSLGETEYWVRGVRILPRTGHTSVWSKWLAINQRNFWWLVDFAFQLNQEQRYRFDCPDNEHYLKLQEWLMKCIGQEFPKMKNGEPLMEFPVALPSDFIVNLGDPSKMSVVDMYRQFYFSQRGKIRMKWTKRDRPDFMDEGNIPF